MHRPDTGRESVSRPLARSDRQTGSAHVAGDRLSVVAPGRAVVSLRAPELWPYRGENPTNGGISGGALETWPMWNCDRYRGAGNPPPTGARASALPDGDEDRTRRLRCR